MKILAVYAISYDLNKPGQDYNSLYEAIKSLGSWWHHLDSTWLLDTHYTAQQVSDKLMQTMDKSDRLLVIRVTREYAGWLTQDAWDWLNSRVF